MNAKKLLSIHKTGLFCQLSLFGINKDKQNNNAVKGCLCRGKERQFCLQIPIERCY